MAISTPLKYTKIADQMLLGCCFREINGSRTMCRNYDQLIGMKYMTIDIFLGRKIYCYFLQLKTENITRKTCVQNPHRFNQEDRKEIILTFQISSSLFCFLKVHGVRVDNNPREKRVQLRVGRGGGCQMLFNFHQHPKAPWKTFFSRSRAELSLLEFY